MKDTSMKQVKAIFSQIKFGISHVLKKDYILGRTDSERMEEMCKINPCYILRNWMAQDVIKAAENGDFSEVWFINFLFFFLSLLYEYYF